MKNIFIDLKDFASKKDALKELVKQFPLSFFTILKRNDNYKDLYDYVISHTKFLPIDANISIRTYCVINNIVEFPKCKKCNQPLSEQHFRGISKGFAQYCSISCSNSSYEKQEKTKNIFLKKFGTTSPLNNPKLREQGYQTKIKKYGDKYYSNREKAKKTCIERYGVDNPAKLVIIRDKIKKTNIKKYGVEHVWQNPEIHNKCIQSSINRFGKDNINNRIKASETYKNHTEQQKKEIQTKTATTNLKRYGVENVMQEGAIGRVKAKKTCVKKYGNENYNNREKAKLTCMAKYGVSSFTKTDKFKQQMKDCNNERMKKQYLTKKSRQTFRYSKDELNAYELLKKKFDIVERQYKCKRYPFKCDFYIPIIDMFIEYNGTWTHGGHAFDCNNKKDRDKLCKMQKKAQTSNYYKSAINTWTVTDPMKRQIAKNNNLNYIECWNIDDVKNFIKSK